ncbi:MAG: hypothetical protein V2I97_00325 [Desulfococcaceae bacterium]|jgi:hypothetical protein|nr:hypothetical protein [Desulfococcaceae bacterium]
MVLRENYVDGLAEEVLTEMAFSFFGERREVEDAIRVLQQYAQALREKETEVETAARFLAYLAVDTKELEAFYTSAGAEKNIFPLDKELPDRFLPEEMPGAFTAKGVYQKLLLHAYRILQKLCDEYMNGKKAEELAKDDPGNTDAAYRVFMGMCRIINEKISKINKENRPGQTLRYFKRFRPETEIRENITGGSTFCGSGSECRINQALSFEQIDPDAFGLKIYPELPPADQMKEKIADCCAKVWNSRQAEARSLMAEVKKRCKMKGQ